MNKTSWFALWGGLFILCAGLGLIPEPTGLLGWALTGLSLLFFLPPAMLYLDAVREKDKATLKLLRNLSAGSLALTAGLLIANFLSLTASEAVGNILYTILVIASAPMVCSGYWLLSLFLWACLLTVSMKALKNLSSQAN